MPYVLLLLDEDAPEGFVRAVCEGSCGRTGWVWQPTTPGVKLVCPDCYVLIMLAEGWQ